MVITVASGKPARYLQLHRNLIFACVPERKWWQENRNPKIEIWRYSFSQLRNSVVHLPTPTYRISDFFHLLYNLWSSWHLHNIWLCNDCCYLPASLRWKGRHKSLWQERCSNSSSWWPGNTCVGVVVTMRCKMLRSLKFAVKGNKQKGIYLWVVYITFTEARTLLPLLLGLPPGSFSGVSSGLFPASAIFFCANCSLFDGQNMPPRN